MKTLEEIKLISEIISHRIASEGNYKLFLIKTSNQESDSLDIGIDCSFILDPKNKYLITKEISENLKHDNFFLIDFSRINQELKKRM